MITTSTPDDWRDLQTQVAKILEECGFSVEIEKKMQTVRGDVELDVYAEETIDGRRYLVICECKRWNSRVPQEVIHAFRTVVSDMGVNIGYIVSMRGFQSGALKASTLTNIKLVTWEEFQNIFEQSWLKHYFSPHLAERLDPLISYTDFFFPKWWPDVPEDKQKQVLDWKDRYDRFGEFILSLTPKGRMFCDIPKLPIINQLRPESDIAKYIPNELLHETGYREFLESAIALGEQAISQFRAIIPVT
jgi:restriction system protein